MITSNELTKKKIRAIALKEAVKFVVASQQGGYYTDVVAIARQFAKYIDGEVK